MAWFEVADGRLRFRGRVDKEPIRAWVASEEGVAASRAAAAQIGFALFGRVRSARRRMSRDLWRALDAPTVRDAVASECDRYVGAWSDVVYAPSLPRVTVALHRLVIVPRVMIAGRAGPGLMCRVAACPPIAASSEPFRAFFSRWILGGMDQAVRRARPSAERPVHARESWACVATDDDFVWVDPTWSGREWRGHLVMFEMPARRFGRRDRRELQDAIARLTQSLPNLTRQQRDATVRLAADQMQSLTLSVH